MNQLSNLSKIKTKSKKRVGRGYGSGVGGHTTFKGNKGQKVRYKVPLTRDGSKIKKSWLKRLPFLRGKGRNKFPLGQDFYIFNLSQIEKYYKSDDTVNFETLAKYSGVNQVKLKKSGVKLLSDSKEFDLKLQIIKDIHLSKIALKKILSSGGKII